MIFDEIPCPANNNVGPKDSIEKLKRSLIDRARISLQYAPVIQEKFWDMKSSNVEWQTATVTRASRERINGHRGAVVWLTGLSGSGKSTLAYAVEERLHQMKCRTFVLDGDNVRHGLCADLGFSRLERTENIRRVGEVAKLFLEAGHIVLTAFISPFEHDREQVRSLLPPGDFIEVYCKCALSVCEERDVKGLYKRARAGEVPEFTGISSPYEEPIYPAVRIDTELTKLNEAVEIVLNLLVAHCHLAHRPQSEFS